MKITMKKENGWTIEDLNELIKTYDEYIRLCQGENSELLGLNIAHGYIGNEENYKKRIEIRAKIKELREKIGIV